MTDRRGLLVLNEGPDGVGKETQTAHLCDHLAREGYLVHRLDFPTYGTDAVADLIRELLREQKEDWKHLSWEARATLFAANRLHYRDELWAWLREPAGSVTVLNRYVPTNQAHMAGYLLKHGEWASRFAWVEHFEYEVCGLPRPDVVLLHSMPAAAARRLMGKRARRDVHEADAPYLNRVARCFQILCEREPAVWRRVPADVRGVVQSPAEVHARVWEALFAHPAWRVFARESAAVRS